MFVKLVKGADEKHLLFIFWKSISSYDEPSKKSIYKALMNLSRDKTIILTTHELPRIDGKVVDLNEIKDKRKES